MRFHIFAVAAFALAASSALDAGDSVGSSAKINGWKFEKWSASGIALDSPDKPRSNAKVSAEAGSLVVTANFSPIPPAPSLSMKLVGKGAVSPAPGSSIQFDGEKGERRVSAKPDKYSKFERWECSGPLSVSNEKALETLATVSGPNAVLTAVFSAEKGWLTTGLWGGGSIDPANGSAKLLDINVPAKISASPNPGYKFSRWQTSGSAKVSDAESAETEATLSSYGGHVSAVFTGLLQNFAKPLDVDPHYKGFSADATANLSIHIIGRGQTDPVAGPYTGVPCSFTIKAKPADGSVFESWETSGRVHVASSDAEETLVYVFGNANLKAVFRPEYAHLRVKAGPGGAIAAPLKANSKVKTAQATPLKAKADEGYKFLKWTLSGHAQIANSSAAETDISLRNNAIAMAVFVRDYAKDGTQASASTSEADGGAGTLVTLSSGGAISANPPQGFHFLLWRAEGSAKIEDELAQSSKLAFSGDGAASVSAVFMPDMAMLKVGVSGDGSASPDTSKAPLKLKIDSSVVLKAVPSETSSFAGWRVSGGVKIEDPASASTKATVSESGTATAIFEPKLATLSLAAYGGGSVDPASQSSVQMGVPVQIEAKPYDGFKFLEWRAKGPLRVASATSAKSSATLSGDASATAVFAPEWATLTLGVAGDGQTEPISCQTINVKPGAWVRIKALPAPDSKFLSWAAQGRAELSSNDVSECMVRVEGGDALVIASMSKLRQDATAKSAGSGSASTERTSSASAPKTKKGSTTASSSASGVDNSQESGWVVAGDGVYPDRIRISWTYMGASLFEVWRKLESEPDSAYVRLIDSWPGQSYEDFSAIPEALYVYKVVAKGKDGVEKASSSDSGYRRK